MAPGHLFGSGLLVLSAAVKFEEETNRLPRQNSTSPTTIGSAPVPPRLLLTFANDTQRVVVKVSELSPRNGAFVANGTAAWLEHTRALLQRVRPEG
jgi:hypothetical protein